MNRFLPPKTGHCKWLMTCTVRWWSILAALLFDRFREVDCNLLFQARGITMKSSSIALLYVPGAASLPAGPNSCSAEEKRDKGKHVTFMNCDLHRSESLAAMVFNQHCDGAWWDHHIFLCFQS